jgi:hypothetical protein
MPINVTRTMFKWEYTWHASGGDDARAVNVDARLFNRHEGYEVLRMIQHVVDHFDYQSEDQVRRIEDLIADDLPGSVRSRTRVFAWLVERLGRGAA